MLTFYILGRYGPTGGTLDILYEPISNSIFTIVEQITYRLMRDRIINVNGLYIKSDSLEFCWSIPGQYDRCYTAIFIDKENNITYIDQKGHTETITMRDMYKYGSYRYIANAVLLDKQGNILNKQDHIRCSTVDEMMKQCRIRLNNVIRVNTTAEKIEKTKQEYDKFIAKTNLLGIDTSFEYSIINNDVILTKYTGTSANVILSSFITAIGENAFKDKHIKTIKLNDGLQTIGNSAFGRCHLNKVNLPDSMKLIGINAFHDIFTGHQAELINTKDVLSFAGTTLPPDLVDGAIINNKTYSW